MPGTAGVTAGTGIELDNARGQRAAPWPTHIFKIIPLYILCPVLLG